MEANCMYTGSTCTVRADSKSRLMECVTISPPPGDTRGTTTI
jgi:hypothetical protein